MIDVLLDMRWLTYSRISRSITKPKAVLLGGASTLRPLYQLMLARECGDWQGTNAQAERLGLTESEIGAAYWEALQWVRQVNSV